MDQSRRAVESYWRSRMIDGATSDEDKVAPVYKLEEICELLRSSHVGIVKEVSEFVLKRLDHKSPIVKQKALRLIKYCVGKSGVEFRREMQRHSAAVRQLCHYKGQPDPLKGDALNKAVRETANDAISAMFSEENNPAPIENRSKRMEGFGNTNFVVPSDDKKSFLSEVVGLGSATLKQGISSFTQAHSLKRDDTGSYKSPNLHRSLTMENDNTGRYEPVQLRNETQSNFGGLGNTESGPWGQDSRGSTSATTNGDSSSSYSGSKTREERLLETIVTAGGVRLQPTRDALQVFLVEAAKLDALALTHALESKLQSPVWQVRMKAVCVLESILRKKDDEPFSIVASYFCENKDVVVKCSESPQSSLREKAMKVLILLNGEQAGSLVSNTEKLTKTGTPNVQMPDLIDTGDSNDFFGTDELKPNDHKAPNLAASEPPLIDEIFGDTVGTSISTNGQKEEDDPFADVAFHANETGDHADDLFSGMTLDDKPRVNDANAYTSNQVPELFDIFGSITEPMSQQANPKSDVNDLMASMSINEKKSEPQQQIASSGLLSESMFSNSNGQTGQQVSNDALSGILNAQVAGINSNSAFPSGTMPFNFPPSAMLNPAFLSQQMNYGAMGNFLAHQQFLASMSNFQHLNNMNVQATGNTQTATSNGGGYSSPLPDIFQPSFVNQAPISTASSSKKEGTRAFDFISDHITAARDRPKRVI